MWTDEDFGYDRFLDFEDIDKHHIRREDGAILSEVNIFKSGAKYSVHLCPNAKQIWVCILVDVADYIQYASGWKVRYSPARKQKGPVTARGYAISTYDCMQLGPGYFRMPDDIAEMLLSARNKKDRGLLTERAFSELVNVRQFWPAAFLPPARKSGQQNDMCDGIDFWVSEIEIPVQVKLETFGGFVRKGEPRNGPVSGNLFFQTHTLPVSQVRNWHGYDYDPRA